MKKSSAKTVHREFWDERLVEIQDEAGHRSLYFGGKYLQSRMNLSSPELLTLPYTRCMLFPLLYTPAPENILLIGLGAGSLVRFLHHRFPHCTIDAVDHSNRVIDLARGYFRLPDSPNIQLHCMDGAHFFNRKQPEHQYDLILLDAFDEQGMATHIYSKRVFALCQKALTKTGTLCCNVWSGDSRQLRDISASLQDCFVGRLSLPVPGRGNIIQLARNDSYHLENLLAAYSFVQTGSNECGLEYKRMLLSVIDANLKLPHRLYYRMRTMFLQ